MFSEINKEMFFYQMYGTVLAVLSVNWLVYTRVALPVAQKIDRKYKGHILSNGSPRLFDVSF